MFFRLIGASKQDNYYQKTQTEMKQDTTCCFNSFEKIGHNNIKCFWRQLPKNINVNVLSLWLFCMFVAPNEPLILHPDYYGQTKLLSLMLEKTKD